MRGSRLHSLLALAATALLSYTQFAAATTSSNNANIPGTRISARQATQQSCNGAPELCGRTYDAVTHMGAHNSAFVRDASTNNSIAGNQYFPATRALDDGLRLLQAQVHPLGDGIELCHSSCALLDAGPLGKWLAGIKTWLEGHPNEVVTLLLVNGDGKKMDAAAFGRVFEAAGLGKYGFVPTNTGAGGKDEWPTLRSMIATNTRLVIFITDIAASDRYPYLLPQFDHVFETPWAVTSPTGFNCTLDRPRTASWAASGPRAAIAAGKLSLMNHFRYNTVGGGSAGLGTIMFPASEDVAATNSPETTAEDASSAGRGTLGAHAERCVGEWAGGKPTFVLVDFYSEGPALATADRLNGVRTTSTSGGGGGGGSAAGDAGGSPSPSPSPSPSRPPVTGGGGGGSSGSSRDSGVAFGLVVFIVGALVML
ncbi:PLC-like phosphodiesterase [Microdochium bolleyi]|uniref:PLC-like phosphodiesterase n=1 Tax=Microdochium bolleyi TaxID=196109 RepID=A0A136JBE4_9PEZI|nr:PLC-like phosphodiesterase [Microdochium bolleyi]